MDGLLRPLHDIAEYKEIVNLITRSHSPLMVTGLIESQKAHLASGVIRELDKPSIFVAPNELSAKKMYEDFKFFLGDRVLFFPAKDVLLYNVEAEGLPITANRLSVIQRMIFGNNYVVIMSVEALMSRILPLEVYKDNTKRLKVGESHSISSLAEFFAAVGYQRMDMVEGRGQFSIRGGILDFFPVNGNEAFRIDFFDDEIDNIKTFDVISQRSIENRHDVVVFPAREIIFDKNRAERAVEKIKSDLEHIKERFKGKGAEAQKLEKRVMHDIEKISNGVFFAGIEKYILYFYENAKSLVEFLPHNSIVFIDEYSRLEQIAKSYFDDFGEAVKDSIEKGNLLPQCSNIVIEFGEVVNHINQRKVVILNTFQQNTSNLNLYKSINISSKPIPSFNGRMELLVDDIKEWKDKKNRIVILAGSKTKAEGLIHFFKENGIQGVYHETIDRSVRPGEVIVIHGSLNKGFEYSSVNFILISDKELLGEERKRRKRRKKLGEKIKAFSELSIGDFIVHQAHGIGQYMGVDSLKVEGITKDYLKIKYLQGDLYVPVSQLDLIQKYIGSEGKTPKINKLGGADWNKAKAKVREAVEELAKGLIRLYAERETLKGHSFSKDTVWQKEFEETFPYEETDDQLQCIDEVKSDMEKSKPMDRLLCGDVGYGKTEVAIRAAFKAVMEGKQVAYLVPTTILAQQQYTNFLKRMKDFAVRVEMLSRFKTPKEQKSIVKEVKEGVVDIIIGTHRILQKDIVFKDLGLVIVDEEQRFGVAHKERLKALKKNVDVLTLTATPIPRTLHMSMLGVRDMSVIEEPPEERFPVQTYVIEHDSDLIKGAIVREMNRGGQVFYLYNRVSSIHRVASEVRNLVPEARVAFAHGQMSEGELEDILMDFLDGEYDVLVCTTIIETGIDMPNVNTIIIEDADKMGLSQLYQLRGRVGRSNRQAYAYLTFKKDKVLSEEAEKRLKAIKEFTEFGSGFRIAMRDLEIRGAGNLLGPEQHGQMNTVGYEMYCKILDDAIKELRGEVVREKVETTIDIEISAYIDDKYINNSTQKITMYKKIASIENYDDVLDIRSELLDRYGDIPKEADNLIEIGYIKSLCTSLDIVSVTQKNDNIIFTFAGSNSVDLKIISELVSKFKRRILFTASSAPYITFKVDGIPKGNLLENIKILLQSIKKLQQH